MIAQKGFTVREVYFCDGTWAVVRTGDGISSQPTIGKRTAGAWTRLERSTACKTDLPKQVYNAACLAG